ncbi:hypothetical protein EV201_1268 [Ancylomarina subtilis]|uniref:Phage abortive infection protein n=1 Tax=Ancylomarina subtilis TaxID=1639035 RepID=A0A4Q7VKK9_9BACT|nr:hypothetical protein [Ancylomarina subtilis]RZT96627.1 hypothetical protein EV201_1268 [Ancylomarina subtilis]
MTTKATKAKIKKVDYNKRANIALGVGAFAVLVLPFIFTQFPSIIDFTETGQIGDTIGGITAPFVGLVGAMLVYYSFKQQMIANQIQIDAITDIKTENRDAQLVGIVNDLSKKILNAINEFEITSDFIFKNEESKEKVEKFFGLEGIVCFYALLIKYKNDRSAYIKHTKEVTPMTLLNNNIGLLLLNLNKISSKETKEIYLDLYFLQIHTLVYVLFKNDELDFEIDSNHIYSAVWKSSKSNINLYNGIKETLEENQKNE